MKKGIRVQGHTEVPDFLRVFGGSSDKIQAKVIDPFKFKLGMQAGSGIPSNLFPAR